MITEPLPPEALEEPATKPEEAAPSLDDGLLRLDLGCGQGKREGFKGVDIAEIDGVDYPGVDLSQPGWPFDDNSVAQAHCSHFLEHLDGDEQITFMNELWRILKPGAEALIICPYGFSPRAWQDPTHKRPIFAECFLYYNRFQREQMKTTHGPYARIVADFDANISFHIAAEWTKKTPEAQAFAARHYVNVVPDIVIKLTKKAADS